MDAHLAVHVLLQSLIAALTESSRSIPQGQKKAAINPYRSLTLSITSCDQACHDDQICNGYSVDVSNNGCYLSRCNMFYDVSCFTCYAASKRYPMTDPYCPTDVSSSPTVEMIRNSEDKSKLPTDNKAEALCPCMCKNEFIAVVELMEKRRKELMLNKSKLSATVRKRTSATDRRTSSTAIGVVSVIILIACGSILICSDICTVLELCYRKCKILL